MIHDIDVVLVDRGSPGRDHRCRRRAGADAAHRHRQRARCKFGNGCIANLTASRISRDRTRKIRFFQPDVVRVDRLRGTGAGGLAPRAAAGRRRRRSKAARSRSNATSRCAGSSTTSSLPSADRRDATVTGEAGRRALELASASPSRWCRSDRPARRRELVAWQSETTSIEPVLERLLAGEPLSRPPIARRCSQSRRLADAGHGRRRGAPAPARRRGDVRACRAGVAGRRASPAAVHLGGQSGRTCACRARRADMDAGASPPSSRWSPRPAHVPVTGFSLADLARACRATCRRCAGRAEGTRASPPSPTRPSICWTTSDRACGGDAGGRPVGRAAHGRSRDSRPGSLLDARRVAWWRDASELLRSRRCRASRLA